MKPECSCHACGNPRRRWNELTMQEKRFADRARVGAADRINNEM